MLAVLCALGSSLLYAAASVLQQRGAAAQPAEQSMKIGLLVRLVSNPGWVIGLAADAGGYILQFAALGNGPLVIVQPLLVCGLLFALPLGAALAGRRLHRADWAAAVAVCVGLAAFLTIANPAAGRPGTTRMHWVVLLSVTLLAAGAMTAAARMTASSRRRALALSAAAGILYGSAAGLTKTSAHLLSRGIGTLLSHWEPYALVGVGAAGMLLAQSAFQAGALDVSLPTMTVADPVISIVIGAAFFGERIASGPAVVVEAVGLAVMAAGVFALARSDAPAAVGGPAG